uniref:Reverse transcriptase domain-containing protein n=1 Tax=Lactuca sativa TaxID=4236 RepID=A0A9R1VNG7_LACSA|nr:hypothetical protein LSAT_V11C400187360 [Lactuca sativa]
MERRVINASSGWSLSNMTPTEIGALIKKLANELKHSATEEEWYPDHPIGVKEMSNTHLESQNSELTKAILLLTKEKCIEPKVKPCGICCKTEHPTDICPLLQEDNDYVQAMGGFQQRPFDQYRNNQAWEGVKLTISSQDLNRTFNKETNTKLHPGFSNLFSKISTKAIFSNHLFNHKLVVPACIATHELHEQIRAHTQGKFPSQTEKNLKHNACVVTHRSGKYYKGPDQQEDEEEEIVVEKLKGNETVKVSKNVSTVLQKRLPPKCVLEDVLVQVNELIFPADFYVLDMGDDDSPNSGSILLGRPFLKTAITKIDEYDGTLSMEFDGEVINFNIYDVMHYPYDISVLNFIDVIEPLTIEYFEIANRESLALVLHRNLSINATQVISKNYVVDREVQEMVAHMDKQRKLRYVIISNKLSEKEEFELIRIVKEYKTAIGWTIADIKGLSPSLCMHKILTEEDYKPSRQAQRRLNPPMMEVVKKEVMKLLDAGMIYPISDSKWVTPVQVVPKKARVTMVEKKEGELVPTRVQNGWHVCIDYGKLNAASQNDHFPLPFIDQMLERLDGKSHYCCLDGFSAFHQIPVAPKD